MELSDDLTRILTESYPHMESLIYGGNRFMHEVIHIIHKKIMKNNSILWKPCRTDVLYRNDEINLILQKVRFGG